MAELNFVFKCFVMSCVLVFALQYKVGGRSLDSTMYASLRNSKMSGWLQDMGTGAVRLSSLGYESLMGSSMLKGKVPTFGSFGSWNGKETVEHREETPAENSNESSAFPEEAP